MVCFLVSIRFRFSNQASEAWDSQTKCAKVTKDIGLSRIMRLSTSTKSFVLQWCFLIGKTTLRKSTICCATYGNLNFRPLQIPKDFPVVEVLHQIESTTCQAGPLHSDDAVDSAEHIHSSNNLAEVVANRGTDLTRTCCDMLRHVATLASKCHQNICLPKPLMSLEQYFWTFGGSNISEFRVSNVNV